MQLSNDQKRILAQTLLGEAGGEGLQGMIAVAHVIKNRAASGRYPSDPVSVALQPQQFSTWNNGAGGNNPGRFGPGSPGYAEAIKAVEEVFSGNSADPTGGATHYWAPSGVPGGVPYWAASETGKGGQVPIGNHVFLAKEKPKSSALTAINAVTNPPPVPLNGPVSGEAPINARASAPYPQTYPTLARTFQQLPEQPPTPAPYPTMMRAFQAAEGAQRDIFPGANQKVNIQGQSPDTIAGNTTMPPGVRPSSLPPAPDFNVSQPTQTPVSGMGTIPAFSDLSTYSVTPPPRLSDPYPAGRPEDRMPFQLQLPGLLGLFQKGAPMLDRALTDWKNSQPVNLLSAPRITGPGGGGAFTRPENVAGTPLENVGSSGSLLPKSINNKRWLTGY